MYTEIMQKVEELRNLVANAKLNGGVDEGKLAEYEATAENAFYLFCGEMPRINQLDNDVRVSMISEWIGILDDCISSLSIKEENDIEESIGRGTR